MADNIIINRIWQDSDFFQIEIECQTDLIVARSKVYTSNDLIDDLYIKIEQFLLGNSSIICWRNGEQGDATTPCISFTFSHHDALGHVRIEVYLEIDDGGQLSIHNCCFYVITEIGLLYQFKEKLPILKNPQLGVHVSLDC